MLDGGSFVSAIGLSSGEFGNLNIATQQFPSPAVATDWTVTVPDTGQMWKLVALHTRLVTSANAANRVVNVKVSDHAGNPYFEEGFDTAVTASLTVPITFTPYVTGIVGGVSNAKRLVFPIPAGPYLPGFTIASVTTAIDVADQWSQIQAWFIADGPLSDAPTIYGSGPPPE